MSHSLSRSLADLFQNHLRTLEIAVTLIPRMTPITCSWSSARAMRIGINMSQLRATPSPRLRRLSRKSGITLLLWPRPTTYQIEQGSVTSAQDRAQQAYSGYNGGNGNRDRYLHENRDGLPRDKNDRHFLKNYSDERNTR